ncbi:MAG: DUF4178 domain-containing protein [Leptospiraceae bacterium]|nr:DUF4178 domain-containing protein [Leptospiraceae bacterium]
MAFQKNVQCPSCGGTTSIRNPAVLQATCEYCTTVFLIDKEGVVNTGKKSRLMPGIAGLAIGSTGTYLQKNFTIVGRVQYKNQDEAGQITLGHWDEWYTEFADGSTGYFSEDMGELIFESALHKVPEIEEELLSTGAFLKVKKEKYLVKETGHAVCAGTEGQLPFPVIPDEHYRFINAIAVKRDLYLSAEFEEDGIQFFSGEKVRPQDIQYTRITREVDSKEAEALRCPSCGSPLDKGEMTATEFTIRCGACNTVSVFSENTGRALGAVSLKNPDRTFAIPLAAVGKLDGIEWTVIGRLYREWKEDGESGFHVEYCLYNAEQGYEWLTCENGHYYRDRVATVRPDYLIAKGITPKAKIKIGNRDYKFFEHGTNTLRYVDGILPWVATLGEVVKFGEAIHPPFVFSEEQIIANKQIREIEHYESEYIETEEVANAFQLTLPKPLGMSAGIPFKVNPVVKIASWANQLLAFGAFVLTIVMAMKGNLLYKESFQITDLRKKDILTRPFEISQNDQSLRINIDTGLSDRWANFAIGLVDAKTETVLADDEVGIEYYSGGSGEDAWTEGSRSGSLDWKIKNAGTYRLLLAVTDADVSAGIIRLEVFEDTYRMGGAIGFSIAWLIMSFFFSVGLRRFFFESRRWALVIESDDD